MIMIIDVDSLMNRDQVESAQNECNLALRELLIMSDEDSEDSNQRLKFGKLLLQLNALLKQVDKRLIEHELFHNRDIRAALMRSSSVKPYPDISTPPPPPFNFAFHSVLLKLSQSNHEFANRFNESFLRHVNFLNLTSSSQSQSQSNNQ